MCISLFQNKGLVKRQMPQLCGDALHRLVLLLCCNFDTLSKMIIGNELLKHAGMDTAVTHCWLFFSG